MTPSLLQKAESCNFDMDKYTNPYTPPSPLHRLPPWISRFLGYRKEQKPDVGNILGAFWSCLGAFCGLAVVAAAFNNTESIQRHGPPALIASFVRILFFCYRGALFCEEYHGQLMVECQTSQLAVHL
jgi:hypothetical protein